MLEHSNTFSRYAGVAPVARWLAQEQIWEKVATGVAIKQKTVKHSPHEKLKDAFIQTLLGEDRLVTINNGIRADRGVQWLFGRERCAEQSLVSSTLDRCDEQSVAGLQAVLDQILHRYGRSRRHQFDRQYLVLDGDMTGLRCGRQAEGSSQGYFADKRGARGRQLGRIVATTYDEIVFQQLYPGQRQLEKSAVPLVRAASQRLGLSPAQRRRTIVRLDGGGGTDDNIRALLAEGFAVLLKLHHWSRCRKLAQSVAAWYPDPDGLEREFGLVTQPIAYDKPTTQVAVRYRNKQHTFSYHVILSTVPLTGLHQLTGRRNDPDESPWMLPFLILKAYDRRSGGIETAFKADKQALGIHRRNKRRFQAQEMLLLLAQLAHNILTWVALPLRQLPAWRSLGPFRLIRDFLNISGWVSYSTLEVYLNSLHPCAAIWCAQAHGYLKVDVRYLYLDKT